MILNIGVRVGNRGVWAIVELDGPRYFRIVGWYGELNREEEMTMARELEEELHRIVVTR